MLSGCLVPSRMSPLRLEGRSKIVFGEDYIFGNATDTVGSIADCSKLGCGDATAVTSYAASIAHVLWISELPWCSKVKRREGTRVSEHVSESC